MGKIGIIVPSGLSPLPNKLEFTAAQILLDYFQTDIEFVLRSDHNSADFEIAHQFWELKSPKGSGKHTIEHQFCRAHKQSANLILDARRCKLTMSQIRSRALAQFKMSKTIKRLIIIDKQSQVTEYTK